MGNLTSVLKQLQQERSRLTSQLTSLDRVISALNGVGNKLPRTRISAAGRARIAAAQRARWTKLKGKKVVAIKGRKLSATALANIRKAQRARWAKWRKANKAA